MSRHAFDPEIASLVGVNAAVIFQNIVWWCERNAIKGRNIHDDNAWTFNSVTAFGDLFPYLTAKQIRTALAKLEDSELVQVDNFNTDNRDRTKWYAVHPDQKAFALMVSPHLPKRASPTFALEGRPLPDINTDSKHTPIPPEGDDLFSAESEQREQEQDSELKAIEEGFNEFWNQWPSHPRKAGKADCRKVYVQTCTGKFPKADKISPTTLNRCARAYFASVSDQQYLKGPLPWLRKPGWEPFLAAKAMYSAEDLTHRQYSMLSEGRVPPSMMDGDQPNDAARYFLKAYGHVV